MNLLSVPRLLAVSAISPIQPRDGYALRVHHLLRELAREWSITLLAPPGEGTPAGVERWIPLPARGWGEPDAGWAEQLRAELRRAAEQWKPAALLLWPGTQQAVLGEAQLPPAVADGIDCGTLTVWRTLCVARSPREFASALRALAETAWLERRIVRSVADAVVVGQADARWLGCVAGRPVGVVPNGVELGTAAAECDEAPAPTAVFTGVLGYEPNVTAACFLARVIWPRVRAELPAAELWIAGRQPLPEVLALAERPGVRVLADVPDMGQVLRRAWLAAAPMRSGAGIKNKVLEAWAVGRVVVLSPLAANGLALDAEASRWIAASAEEAARKITQLLSCAEERRRAGAHVRALAAAHHSWSAAAQELSVRLQRAARSR